MTNDNTVYFISLILIACGLVIAISAYFSLIDIVTSNTYNFQQAGLLYKQLIIGGLIAIFGISLLVWKTIAGFASRNRSTQAISSAPTISISNSSDVVVTLAERDAVVMSTLRDLQGSHDNNMKTVANLLLDLKNVIDKEPNFSDELKVDALEQIVVLGEAAKETSKEKRKRSVKNATRILRGIGAELPSATQFINACTKLVSQIASLLGLS